MCQKNGEKLDLHVGPIQAHETSGKTEEAAGPSIYGAGILAHNNCASV